MDSEVRRKILRELTKGPKTLSDFVTATGKAKSTLSAVHLRELLEAALVVEKRDPHDSRVVWYHLLGRAVGAAGPDQSPDVLAASLQQEASERTGVLFALPWNLIDPRRAFAAQGNGDVDRHLAAQVAQHWAVELRETRFPALLQELGQRLRDARIAILSDVSPLGHHFRVKGFQTRQELAFFCQVLEALLQEKAGLACAVRSEEQGTLVRIQLLD